VKCSGMGQPGTAPASALSAGPAASPFSAGAPAPAGAAAGSELRDGSRAPAAARSAACDASPLRHGLLLCTGQRLFYGGLQTASQCRQAARLAAAGVQASPLQATPCATDGRAAHMPWLHSAVNASCLPAWPNTVQRRMHACIPYPNPTHHPAVATRGTAGEAGTQDPPGPASSGAAGGCAEGAGDSACAAAMERAVVGVSDVSGMSSSRAKMSATISASTARDACVSSSARAAGRAPPPQPLCLSFVARQHARVRRHCEVARRSPRDRTSRSSSGLVLHVT
jgi:hypothetical protein